MEKELRKSGIDVINERSEYRQMEQELAERAKKLSFLYDIANITGAPDTTLYKRFEKIANLLPKAWQYPKIACARITINDSEFKTKNYRQTQWQQSSDIIVHGARAGAVEVGYLEAMPETDEGPFSTEERLLIDAVAERLGIITEHRRAEEALAESEEKYRAIFEQASDSIVLIDMETEALVDFNDRTHENLGYRREEFAKLKITDIDVITPAEGIMRHSENIRHQKTNFFETKHRTKDGDIRDVLVSDKSLNIGGKIYALAVWHDITERKQSEELLKTVSDNSPLGIYILQDEKLQYINPQFQKLTGYSEKELLDRELLSLVSAEDSDVVKSSTVFTLKEERPYPCEYRIISKAGQIKWVMQTVSAIQYQDREALLGNLMDITERKYLERKVIEYEELSKLKSDILATVSHELRTPLATIKGYSTMMLDYFPKLSSYEKRSYLKSIDNATDRLAKLVDNLLDTSRMEAGLLKLQKAPVSISKLIREVAAEARVRANQYHIPESVK